MPVDLPRRLLAEVVGTFGFFFVGFTGIAALTTQGSGAIEAVGVAAGFGFGLAAMIFAFGHISGGHYNPAVSAGLAAAKRFPIAEVPRLLGGPDGGRDRGGWSHPGDLQRESCTRP